MWQVTLKNSPRNKSHAPHRHHHRKANKLSEESKLSCPKYGYRAAHIIPPFLPFSMNIDRTCITFSSPLSLSRFLIKTHFPQRKKHRYELSLLHKQKRNTRQTHHHHPAHKQEQLRFFSLLWQMKSTAELILIDSSVGNLTFSSVHFIKNRCECVRQNVVFTKTIHFLPFITSPVDQPFHAFQLENRLQLILPKRELVFKIAMRSFER